jgi:hypothetical protein
VTGEYSISVSDDHQWQAMQLEDIVKEQLNNLLGMKGVAQGDEMCIFSEFVNHYQDGVFAFRLWKCFNEIHGNMLPSHIMYGQGL